MKILSAGEHVENLDFSYFPVWNTNGIATFEDSLYVSYQVKCTLNILPSNLPFSNLPKKIKNLFHTNIHL